MKNTAFLSAPLLRWLPALAWTGVIAWFSSATFAASETGGVLQSLLQGLWPGLTPTELAFYHTVLRKGAHVTAYAVLSLCWQQALEPGLQRWHPKTALQVLALCLAVACLDELNQSQLPSRTGSPYDVAWDMSGAVAMQFLLAVFISGFQGFTGCKPADPTSAQG